ncbi:MAG: hypothetical protein KDB54_09505 [Solirubrobacterales bacterium]|nr:hypothetical protein [Solirubrobacterales bacterium]
MNPGPPEQPGLWERIRDWRLPVRYRVPPRNDLIAFALMALAFGLMVGLAIAPGWGNAGSARAIIGLPAEESPDTAATGDTGSTVAALQPPAGGEESSSSGGGSSTTVPTSTSSGETVTTTQVTTQTDTGDGSTPPPADTTDNNYTDPPASDDPSGDTEDQPALTATVVGTDDAGYAVADSAGNLLYIHYPNPVATRPKVGKRIGTDITPVDNGTFLQSDALESEGSAASSKLSGMVSFIDPESGVITVSSRGVSVAIDAAKAMEKSASPPVLGSWVTGTISFPNSSRRQLISAERTRGPADMAANGSGAENQSRIDAANDDPTGEDQTEADPVEEDPIEIPSISAKSIESTGDPLTQIEISGAVSWDSVTRQLTIGADGFGVLNREITIGVTKKLALKGIEDGLTYAVSADVGSSGALKLAGLSANFSLKAAGDSKQAFGTHAN